MLGPTLRELDREELVLGLRVAKISEIRCKVRFWVWLSCLHLSLDLLLLTIPNPGVRTLLLGILFLVLIVEIDFELKVGAPRRTVEDEQGGGIGEVSRNKATPISLASPTPAISTAPSLALSSPTCTLLSQPKLIISLLFFFSILIEITVFLLILLIG